MQFLIQAEWVQQEAEERGVKVTDAQIKKSLRGPEEAGLPERQAVQGVPQDLGHDRGGHPLPGQARPAQQKLTQKVTEDAKKVSDEDISEYYEKNKKRFAQPERRDLRVVLTKTEAKADQAKKALDSGSPSSRS